MSTHHKSLSLQNDRTEQPTINGQITYVAGTGFRGYAEGSAITLGAGGGAAGTLDQTYDNGRTITVDVGAVTFNGVDEDTAVVSITGDGDSAGALLSFSHITTTRNDILGSGSNWSITGAGAAVLTAIAMADNQLITLGTGSDATIGWNGSVLNIAGVTDFDNNITMAASATITQTGVAGSTVYTITAGDVVWSDTSLLLTDADNAESVTIINNTATTIGAAATAAILQIESTSLTTGAAVNVQLTEGTLNGGFYYSAWDATAGARVFSVAENGDVTITGAGAANALTISNGDVVLSDGSITLTDADDAASFSLTNNTATTANTVLFTGSGVHTGTGTTAFFRVTQSGATTGDVANIQTDGLTSGTALRLGSTGTIVTAGRMLEIIADSATTSTGLVSLSADALTTGVGLLVDSLSNEAMTSGALAQFTHTASGTTVAAKTGSLVTISSSITELGTSTQDFDVASITRTSIHTTAGTLTAQGSVLRLEVVSTQTNATLTDTVAGLEIVLAALSGGDAISVTHSGTTTGQALVVAASQTTVDGVIALAGNAVTTGNFVVVDTNGLTEGIGLELTHTTSVITTGSVCRITSTGIDTGTAQGTLLDLVSSAATAATVVSLVADALTGGIGLLASFDGLTTGEGVSLTHTTSIIADGGSLFRLSSTGIDTGGATNGTVFDLSSTAQLAGVVAKLTCNALTTGTALQVTSSGTITSAGQGLVNIVGTGITTGDALKIDLTEGTLTTGNYLNCYDDTAGATVFRVAEDGATTITGAAGSTMLTITAGDLVLSDGAIASAREQVTLGVGASAIAVDSNVVEVTGDGGGNTVTTITGGVAGQILVLIFVDGNVTINDDDTHGANSIDLVGANTTFADDSTLTLVFDGTSYYELSRSIND